MPSVANSPTRDWSPRRNPRTMSSPSLTSFGIYFRAAASSLASHSVTTCPNVCFLSPDCISFMIALKRSLNPWMIMGTAWTTVSMISWRILRIDSRMTGACWASVWKNTPTATAARHSDSARHGRREYARNQAQEGEACSQDDQHRGYRSDGVQEHGEDRRDCSDCNGQDRQDDRGLADRLPVDVVEHD